jgi:hypothetical protein
MPMPIPVTDTRAARAFSDHTVVTQCKARG